MRRTIEQALDALRAQVNAWAKGGARPDLRVFVYPPEWEALMLYRLPTFVDELRSEAVVVSLEDVGQGFLGELERRKGLEERLVSLERDELLHDLGVVANSYLRRVFTAPLEDGEACRILMNTGSIGTFVSYSSVTNEMSGSPASDGLPATVLAFPGEADERSLNLLRLRIDTNYRVPRI